MGFGRAVAGAALVAITAPMAFAAQGQFSRTLNVSGTPQVEVSSGSGDIHVHVGDGSTVIINAKLKSNNNWSLFGGNDEGSVQQRIDKIVAHPPIEQTGSIIRIGKFDDRELQRGISISYDVTVPKQSETKESTGSGDIEVDNTAGTLKASTGSGNITLRTIGADVHADTGSGDVNAENVNGNIKVSTGSGGVRVIESGTGTVHASTGSGHIDVQGIRSAFEASTGSGGIHAAGEVHDTWSMSTGSGDVKLDVPNDSKFTLSARAVSGSIHSDLPITMNGSLGRHELKGTVNGGGPTLSISSGSGDIEIR